MKKIQLEIVGVFRVIIPEDDTDPEGLLLRLKELNGPRSFSFKVGYSEGISINIALEEAITQRPVTHELLKNIMNICGLVLQDVVVCDHKEDVFYAKMHCFYNGPLEIDSRPSDAITLALRFGCPIWIHEDILEIVKTTPRQEIT